MPSPKEIQYYLAGLWLLFKQDPAGFRQLDVSDRGMVRSFWSMIYCLPASILTWGWLRIAYQQSVPEGAAGLDFFFRLAMVEAMNWIMPLVMAGLFAWLVGIGPRFTAIVVAVNWLALPFSYAFAVLVALLIVAPGLSGFIALCSLILMMLMAAAYLRIFRMVCGGETLIAAALTLIVHVPTMLLSDLLKRFLDIYVG